MRLQAGFSLLSEQTKQAIMSEQDQLLNQAFAENVVERLRNQTVLAVLWERLSPIEQEAAQMFLRYAPQGFLSKREWDRLAKAGSASWLTALTRLRRVGLIVTVRKLWSEIGYLMPLEVREGLTAVVSPAAKNGYNDFLTKSLSYYIPAGRGIHLDMFALLVHIFNEDVPLTKKRRIHGRYLPRMASLFSFDDRHVADLMKELMPDAKSYSTYPPQLAMLLDIGMRLGLLTADGEQLQIAGEKIDAWLAESPHTQMEELLRTIVDHYLLPEPWLEAANFEMRKHPGSDWHSVSDLLNRLGERGFSLPDNPGERLLEMWLHPLLGLGLIRLGRNQEGTLYYSWNQFSAQEVANGWYMEPTADLLIPAGVSLSLLWELSRYANLCFEGEMVKGSLQEARIQHELAKGMEEAKIVTFLQTYCFHPIPEAVKGQINQWAKKAKQIRLEHVICVRTVDGRVLKELLQLPSLSPFLTDIISETSFLISLRQEKELLRLLKEYGYQPISGGRVGATKNKIANQEPGEESPMRSGLFDIRCVWQEYQIENVFPAYAEAIPQLALLPRLWTQHFQSYHPKTLRDLLQRSHELELTVRLETKEGEREGTVQRVHMENGYWSVTLLSGKKVHRYALEGVKRARILLPHL